MIGTPSSRQDHLGDLQTVDLALQQGVDDQHVGLKLPDWSSRLATVGDDVEQLDLRLRVEQAADVLGDLRHVLDEEQARRSLGPASADYTHEGSWRHPSPERPRPDRPRAGCGTPPMTAEVTLVASLRSTLDA